VVGHELLFDILDGLSNNFKAKDVELIVLVLRTVGFLLRKDSPDRLRTFILQVQKQSSEAAKGKEETTSLSRVQVNNGTKHRQD
jgi:nucleolar MIF4G domain-containing protein 1